MLCPRPTPLNRRPTVPNLPNPHSRRPPAQRVRSSVKSAPRWFRNAPSANRDQMVALRLDCVDKLEFPR
jgi:hypothetical protein